MATLLVLDRLTTDGARRTASGARMGMIVAGVVIETIPGAAPRVAARLLRARGLELHGGDGDRRLAAVFTGDDARALEALAERLVQDDPEVLGVFPTYVADEEDPGDARASATASLRAVDPGGDGH